MTLTFSGGRFFYLKKVLPKLRKCDTLRIKRKEIIKMKLKDKVRAVLDSELSQYAISKKTGISQGSLSELRRGKRNIGNLTIDVAQKLADLYEEMK